MDYYLAIKIYEVVIHVTTWLNVENNLLYERSESQKTNIVWFHLYKIELIDNSIEVFSILLFASGWEGCGVEWGISGNVYGVSLWGDDKLLKLDMIMVVQLCVYI